MKPRIDVSKERVAALLKAVQEQQEKKKDEKLAEEKTRKDRAGKLG